MRSPKSSSAASSSRANEEPHVWPWQFSRVEGSPWNDIRVRKAANLCIDREGLKDGLLAGLMVPATGTFEPGHPWRGKPTFQIKYDKPAAQKLMQEAGFGPNKKLTVKVQTSASGSGQMLPLPMNEYLQQALAECYFDVQLDVIEWNTLFTNWRRGAKDPSANGANADQRHLCGDGSVLRHGALPAVVDGAAGVEQLGLHQQSRNSTNWSTKARQTFDPAARDAALAELHAASVDDAAFLYVAHDVGPRAMSPKIKGFVQPKSWFVDFSPVTDDAVRTRWQCVFPSPLVGEGALSEAKPGEGSRPSRHDRCTRMTDPSPRASRATFSHKGRRKNEGDPCLSISPGASSM